MSGMPLRKESGPVEGSREHKGDSTACTAVSPACRRTGEEFEVRTGITGRSISFTGSSQLLLPRPLPCQQRRSQKPGFNARCAN